MPQGDRVRVWGFGMSPWGPRKWLEGRTAGQVVRGERWWLGTNGRLELGHRL